MRPWLLLVLLVSPALQAAERIVAFQSDIQVQADGAMEVIETITVRAEGRQIRRGIYRDFPTQYRDRAGNRVRVRFEVLGVRRGGKPEAWFTRDLDNGVRVYAGREGVNIPAGEHVYEFTYRTDRQLGFYEGHDELYWNVTGNGWAFPIDRTTAYVYLPRSVPRGDIGVEAYTGRSGSTGSAYEAGVDADGVAWFQATRPLAAGEGLTLVATWPKGHVRAPSAEQALDWFLQDNGHVVAGVVGVLLLLAYYGVAWLMVGRDPPAGVVLARYEPPEGYSPAAMRYVRRMGYDHTCFTAALVNLAVKGHVVIEEEDGEFQIRPGAAVGGKEKLAPGEKALRDRLLAGGALAVTRSNHAKLSKAIDAHRVRLELDYERLYFSRNVGPTAFGVLLSLLVLATAVLWSGNGAEMAGTAFMLVWLSGWSFGTFMLLSRTVAAWRAARGVAGHGGALFLTLFSVPFVGGWFMGAGMLMELAGSGAATVALLVCLIGINVLFYNLMKAPTVQGRRLLDEVDGFLEYLSIAEADELRLANPPRKTPELFERYLPYAIALGVEDVWGERFEAVLRSAHAEQGYQGPSWYHGSRGFSPTSLASNLGATLAGSVSSSSQAPGSSSGSSGGGSSGGGGGGGGGGGW